MNNQRVMMIIMIWSYIHAWFSLSSLFFPPFRRRMWIFFLGGLSFYSLLSILLLNPLKSSGDQHFFFFFFRPPMLMSLDPNIRAAHRIYGCFWKWAFCEDSKTIWLTKFDFKKSLRTSCLALENSEGKDNSVWQGTQNTVCLYGWLYG